MTRKALKCLFILPPTKAPKKAPAIRKKEIIHWQSIKTIMKNSHIAQRRVHRLEAISPPAPYLAVIKSFNKLDKLNNLQM